jgi:hypothetical protein
MEFWKSINKAVDTATAILVLFGIVFSSNVKSNVSATMNMTFSYTRSLDNFNFVKSHAGIPQQNDRRCQSL